jgi:2-hydroxychromene-2-carboxylate isomerase
MIEPESIRFYFSFRSPYAWIAAERWGHELGDLATPVERIAMFPTAATYPNDPALVPNKLRYIGRDVKRLTREYGLPLKFPAGLETDWAKAHAAYCGADELGRGERFMLEMFRARFSRGLDIGLNEVIADAAERCELDAKSVLSASIDPQLRDRVTESFRLGQEVDGIFGVPSFVYRKELFWGHDRMRQLRSAITATQTK